MADFLSERVSSSKIRYNMDYMSKIVSNPSKTHLEKAKLLESGILLIKLDYTSTETESEKARLVPLYLRAAHFQRIYHLLHETKLTQKELISALKKYPDALEGAICYDSSMETPDKMRLLRKLAETNPSIKSHLPKLVATVIRNAAEPEYNIDNKINLITQWQAYFKKQGYPDSIDLKIAKLGLENLNRGNEFFSGANAKYADGAEPVFNNNYLKSKGIGVDDILAHGYFKTFLDGKSPEFVAKVRRLIEGRYHELSELCEGVMSHSGSDFPFRGVTLKGARAGVTSLEVVSQAALNLVCARQLLGFAESDPIHPSELFPDAIVNQEVQWDADFIGFTKKYGMEKIAIKPKSRRGKTSYKYTKVLKSITRNGIGNAQLTPGVIFDICFDPNIKKKLEERIRANGGEPFENLGKFYNAAKGRMDDVVLVKDQDNYITPTEYLKKHGSFHSEMKVKWNPDAEKMLLDPGFSTPLSQTVMYHKKWGPNQNDIQAEEAASNYNGNTAELKNGETMQQNYGKKVKHYRIYFQKEIAKK